MHIESPPGDPEERRLHSTSEPGRHVPVLASMATSGRAARDPEPSWACLAMCASAARCVRAFRAGGIGSGGSRATTWGSRIRSPQLEVPGGRLLSAGCRRRLEGSALPRTLEVLNVGSEKTLETLQANFKKFALSGADCSGTAGHSAEWCGRLSA